MWLLYSKTRILSTSAAIAPGGVQLAFPLPFLRGSTLWIRSPMLIPGEQVSNSVNMPGTLYKNIPGKHKAYQGKRTLPPVPLLRLLGLNYLVTSVSKIIFLQSGQYQDSTVNVVSVLLAAVTVPEPTIASMRPAFFSPCFQVTGLLPSPERIPAFISLPQHGQVMLTAPPPACPGMPAHRMY